MAEKMWSDYPMNMTGNITQFPYQGLYHPFSQLPTEYAVPLLGYMSPFLVFITVITNTLVVVVLFRKHMRSSTNYILAGMAMSDMLTGLFPLPVMIYFFGFGHHSERVPNGWCFVSHFTFTVIPVIFHTASIWLTMGLAIQRYIYICHSFHARKWCTIRNAKKGTFIVYVVAILSQISRFLDTTFEPVEVPSLVDPERHVISCREGYRKFIDENQNLYFNFYFWFRAICIHLIPCTILVILNALLISAMRTAQVRRMQLLKQNKKSECKKLKDSNCTTLMLVAVVGLFLLVEFPLGILIILNIVENTFGILIFKGNAFPITNLLSNFFILLSYPLNFFIYCAMSRQFRETFKQMFLGGPLPVDKECSQYMTVPTENGKTCTTNPCHDTTV